MLRTIVLICCAFAALCIAIQPNSNTIKNCQDKGYTKAYCQHMTNY